MMNNFQRNIRDLPWRKPSEALRRRIFDNRPEEKPSGGRQQNRPTKWSFVMAAAAGFIGFMAGTMLPSAQMPTEVASVDTDIRVVETFSVRNSFDFSAGAIQIMPGEFTSSISIEGETESIR